jgi:hypothetical protein
MAPIRTMPERSSNPARFLGFSSSLHAALRGLTLMVHFGGECSFEVDFYVVQPVR